MIGRITWARGACGQERRRGSVFVYAAALMGAASTVILSVQSTGQVLWTSPPTSQTIASSTLTTLDATPSRLLLVPRRDLLPGTQVVANTVRLSGITVPVGIAVSPGVEVQVDGGAWTSGPTVAERGKPIVLRVRAPAAGTTATHRLTTGTLTTSWTVAAAEQATHSHQILYGPWGACSAAAPCDGTGQQSRDILCLRSDGRFVAVGECNPALTAVETRDCPSPAGTAACAPPPALAIGAATQYCAAGSAVRATCTGFTCPDPYTPRDGACVSTRQSLPVVTVTAPATVGEEAGPLRLIATADYAPLVDLVLPVALAATSEADGEDVTGGPWSLVIAAGQTSGVLDIPVVDDPVSEPDEIVRLSVGAPAGGATLDAGAAAIGVTLIDDDTLPTLDISAGTTLLTEPAGSTTVTVSLSRDSARTITVPLVLGGSGADDVALSAASVTFAPRTRTASVTLTVQDDPIHEQDEVVTIAAGTITPAGAVDTSGVAQTAITLRDDEAVPTVSLAPASLSVTEGQPGRSVTAVLDRASDRAIMVGLAPSNGEIALPASVTIPAGQTSASVTVAATQDAVDEADETAGIAITAITPVGAAVAGAGSTVTILDDDAAPTLSLSAPDSVVETDSGTSTLNVTITRTGATEQTVSAHYTFTIAAIGDPNIAPGAGVVSGTTVTFGPQETSRTIAFTITHDRAFHGAGNETVTLALDSLTNATAGGATSVTTTLAEDDIGLIGSGSAADPWRPSAGVALATCDSYFDNTNLGDYVWTSTASGIYRIRPSGSDVDAMCMMMAGEGWTMVYKWSHRNAGDPLAVLNSAGTSPFAPTPAGSTQSSPYVNRSLINSMLAAGRLIRVGVWAGNAERRFITFNGTGNVNSWFAEGRVVANNFGLAAPYNYFNMVGLDSGASHRRRFHINRSYGGCPADVGYLTVLGVDDACGAGWRYRTAGEIIYSDIGAAANFTTQVSLGDTFVIMVR